MIQAAVFGFGNIGSGVVAVLEENREQIARVIPGGIAVKYILDIRDFPDSPYADRIVHDVDVILNDPEISVVCETMGGKEPAYTFSRRALERGISVCSSNKELVEAFGPKLLAAAAEHHCSYLFEASVGGGIPLITPMLNCLVQEKITEVMGILNGTTNYMLTKMQHCGADYGKVLQEAQELGYAERDPRADVEGHDTGRKIAILSSLMCGKTVRYDEISCEGITKITPEDFVFAAQHGYTIRLLGMSRLQEDAVSVLTAPFLVPEGHPLYGVTDVFNGVLVHGTKVDDVMFYGRGAGKLPTGSAVAADMILASRNIGSTVPIAWSEEQMPVVPAGERISAFFIRGDKAQEEAVLKALDGKLEAVWEAEDSLKGDETFALVTKECREKEIYNALEEISGIRSMIRMLPKEA